MSQVTVSQMSVSEIGVVNTALTAFMKLSSADSVTMGQRVEYTLVSTVA